MAELMSAPDWWTEPMRDHPWTVLVPVAFMGLLWLAVGVLRRGRRR